MNTEMLECKRLTVGALYRPMRIDHALLDRIYADITRKYPYSDLKHLPDGIRMANGNVNDFFVQNNRLQVNEPVEVFHAAKEKAMDLFDMASRSLNISEFAATGVKIIAAIPTGKGEAGNILLREVFGALGNKFSVLGGGFKGAGLRVVLHEEAVRQVKIEPFFGDLSSIYIEVDTQYPKPVKKLEEIDEAVNGCYDYIFENIAAFFKEL